MYLYMRQYYLSYVKKISIKINIFYSLKFYSTSCPNETVNKKKVLSVLTCIFHDVIMHSDVSSGD